MGRSVCLSEKYRGNPRIQQGGEKNPKKNLQDVYFSLETIQVSRSLFGFQGAWFCPPAPSHGEVSSLGRRREAEERNTSFYGFYSCLYPRGCTSRSHQPLMETKLITFIPQMKTVVSERLDDFSKATLFLSGRAWMRNRVTSLSIQDSSSDDSGF